MKRNLDLLRDLLLAAEDSPPGDCLTWLSTGEHDADTVAAHVELLIEVGYVDGDVIHDEAGTYLGWSIDRMTMDGHDYLDSVRDSAVYTETKKRLAKVGGSAALEVVKAVANGVTTSLLGLG